MAASTQEAVGSQLNQTKNVQRLKTKKRTTKQYQDIFTNMIVLFAGFGPERLYVGQMRYALTSIAPKADITYLICDARLYQPKCSRYLLGAYSRALELSKLGLFFSFFLDPGVSGPRDPLMKSVKGKWFLGLNNGIFERIVCSKEKVTVWKIQER